MTPNAVFNLFRTDVVDDVAPYLWTDDEVWEYLADAFEMFVRLTGGIPDTTSDITKIPVVAGQMYSTLDTRILKIRRAVLSSTGRPLKVLNVEDTPVQPMNDYGAQPPVGYDYLPGPVTQLVIGEEDGLCRFVQVPVADDTVLTTVYRLPLEPITEASPDTALDEIHFRHHRNLTKWMKHRGYGKHDAETFDKSKSDDYKQEFEEYCSLAKAEKDRQKSKVRVVAYGGI